MGIRSVVMVSSLLPVAVIGELCNPITTVMELLSIPVNGQVTGFLLTSVEVVLVILVALASAFPTSAFLDQCSKVQNLRNAQDHSHHRLLHPRQVQVLHQEELAQQRLARTTMEQICSRAPLAQAALTNVAANAHPMMDVLATLGFMTTRNVG